MIKRLYRINDVNLEVILKDKFNHTDLFIKKHLWKYDYMITKIINKMIYNKSKEYFRISSKELNNKFGEVRINGKKMELYSLIRNELKELGIIRWHTTGTSDYTTQSFKRQAYYKITNEFRSKGWKQVNYELTDYIKLKMEKTEEYSGLYGQLRDNLSQISIQYNEAIAFCNESLLNKRILRPKKNWFVWDKNRTMNEEIYSYWITSINAIHDGEYNFSVDLKGSGRIYNFLSSLPNELRQFIRINGKEVVEMDIANSQPLLFLPLLKDVAHKEDVVLYKELVETGEFYRYIKYVVLGEDDSICICNEKKPQTVEEKMEYNMFKIDFFSKIFFSTENKNYKWRQLFDEAFPTVSAVITANKKDNYKDLALLLQRTESDIMINTVSRKLIENGNDEFFTIHDAIYTTKENVEIVYNVISDTYNNLGIKPTLTIK